MELLVHDTYTLFLVLLLQRPLPCSVDWYAPAWVRAQVNPVGFVVDEVALGQVFLRVFRFAPVNIIPP
jgi:hypothetical protein